MQYCAPIHKQIHLHFNSNDTESAWGGGKCGLDKFVDSQMLTKEGARREGGPDW